MKKILLILLLLICAKTGICQQLILTGTIIGAAKHDSVEVNESYDGNYWKKNSVYLKTDKTGSFHISFPDHTIKFIMLIYKENKQWLLLSPGRPLQVNININKPGKFSFSGKAKPENDLMQKLKLEDERNLSFIKELRSKNSYANWSVDSVISIKLPIIRHSLDSTQRLVHGAILPPILKKAIATEVNYFYANAISLNLGGLLNNYKNRISYNTHFIDTVLSNFKVPTKDELNTSISANSYLDPCFRFKLWKTVYDYRTEKNKDRADSIFIANTGVSYKDLENDPDRTNEMYLFSTRMKLMLPQYAWEKHLTNLLFNYCMSGQLQCGTKLLYFIRANCIDSQYKQASERMFLPLKGAREQYADNLNIKIRPDYKNISSLKSLLAPYKGKIVLIDMWGTWCPHCIEDMVFEPALKDRLKGKDIVFLYIAMNEDKDDEVWRDFIFINNLTGEHVRRTPGQIGALWNELGIPDSQQAYPHYFIIDRSGTVIVNNAKRPSDGEALYRQLQAAY
ncbi:TlpA family protein disulfide reductase [Mucilaginibacter psychrotolerans]|uniref:TlpA family protein disulfide reductase n=1 Tax=Mucilaginibacter psychrotolerans TaxID=1524096 RepID=A0A4Y8S6H4_9SPHI|nr:TlpA disulfide reductase family protein [Mucilaginibacter psychrotolerans]TFF33984.1 TlpA family protein disulfide reductase [Mucilaginibacter psychrotolerans]